MGDNHVPREKIVVRSSGWWTEQEPRNRFTIPLVMLLIGVGFFFLGSWYHSKTDPDFKALQKASDIEKDSLKAEAFKNLKKADQSQADAEVYYETSIRWKAKHDAVALELKKLKSQHGKQDIHLDSLSYDELDGELFTRYGASPGMVAEENQ